jgi:hypothetical protein
LGLCVVRREPRKAVRLPNRIGGVLQTVRRIAVAPSALWSGFLLVHAWLAFVGLTNATLPFGDVTLVYRPWVENALNGQIVGINEPWVYPVVALLPMLAAMVLGSQLYIVGWLMVVIVTNAAVFAYLLSRGRLGGSGNLLRVRAAWWWLGFLLLLGPVALGRIDVMAVAFAMVGLLVAQSRPTVAGAMLAIATWIKVWPAALVAVVVITIRRRVGALVAALVTGAAIGVGALLLGSGWNMFGFVTEQSGRGLQIESPVSNIWLWIAARDPGAAQVYYDRDILTFQVTGSGSDIASAWMTPLMVVALAAVLLLGVFVVRTGAFPTHVLPAFSLAVVTALIVFNKVGSPQFILWLAAPVVLGIVSMGNHFRAPALIVAGLALLTQLIYPFSYDQLLLLNPAALILLSLRNILLIVLFGVAVRMLWQSRRLPRKAFAQSR